MIRQWCQEENLEESTEADDDGGQVLHGLRTPHDVHFDGIKKEAI